MDVAVRQMVDVINGVNTFKAENLVFHNLAAYKYREGNKVMTFDDVDKITQSVPGEVFHTSGKHKDVQVSPFMKANFITVGLSRGTLPGFPFIVHFSSRDLQTFDIVTVYHQKSSERFEPIPLMNGRV